MPLLDTPEGQKYRLCTKIEPAQDGLTRRLFDTVFLVPHKELLFLNDEQYIDHLAKYVARVLEDWFSEQDRYDGRIFRMPDIRNYYREYGDEIANSDHHRQ